MVTVTVTQCATVCQHADFGNIDNLTSPRAVGCYFSNLFQKQGPPHTPPPPPPVSLHKQCPRSLQLYCLAPYCAAGTVSTLPLHCTKRFTRNYLQRRTTEHCRQRFVIRNGQGTHTGYEQLQKMAYRRFHFSSSKPHLCYTGNAIL
jgi:hypothetical protein